MGLTTRRISVASEQLQSDALRAQLFSTCCAYGVVEWVQYEEDPNYNTTTVHIQFQRLSSADRFYGDVHNKGNFWQIQNATTAPCVGADVVLSSTEVLHFKRFAAVLPTFPCTELLTVPVNGNSAGEAPAVSVTPTFEEKTFHLHGRSSAVRTSAVSPKVTAEQEATMWASFESEAALVRRSCLGPFWAVLHFSSAHGANEFLQQHQLALAEQHNIYAIHAGTPPSCTLAAAVPRMLSRRAVSGGPIEGCIVRGYVVAMPSNTYCVVDAGLYPSVEQPNLAMLINTHTNFLSVSLGDEVQVQLSLGGGLTLADEGMVGGKLLRVTGAIAFSNRRTVAKAQLPNTAALTLRTANLTRSLRSDAASRPSLQSGRAGNSGKSGANDAVRSAASVGKTLASPAPRFDSGGATTRTGTGHCESRTSPKQSGMHGPGSSAERICPYPAGLGVYSRLLVRVERIEEDGLHTRCIDDTENCGYVGPVFVPSALVPRGINGSEQSWRAFAVVGERMHVALLYMLAVGGSAATMRGVASKKDADLRRVTAASASISAEAMGTNAEGTLVSVGTSVSAVAMLRLSYGDLGVPPASQRSSHFPALLLRPGARTSSTLHQMPLLLPLSDTGKLDVASLSTSPATLTISEVVDDLSRGQYAVVVPYSLYTARQAQRTAAQERRKTAEVDEVKRRLAAVMGADILKVLNDDEKTAAKRFRADA